jgi:cobyrinic acid a,c-diamide synthase
MVGEPAGVSRLYRLTPRKGGEPVAEGYASRNVLASYVHLHFGSNPDAAQNLVAGCQRYKDNLSARTKAVATNPPPGGKA